MNCKLNSFFSLTIQNARPIVSWNYQFGIRSADLLDAYPNLNSADLANARSYGGTHRGEIETSISENGAKKQRIFSHDTSHQ